MFCQPNGFLNTITCSSSLTYSTSWVYCGVCYFYCSIAVPLVLQNIEYSLSTIIGKIYVLFTVLLHTYHNWILSITGEISASQAHGATASELQNEAMMCEICFERKRDSIFLCGHGTCSVCCKALRECHLCRQPIEQIIKIFIWILSGIFLMFRTDLSYSGTSL